MEKQKETLKKLLEKGKTLLKDVDDVITEEFKGSEMVTYMKNVAKDVQVKVEDFKEAATEKVKKFTTEEVFAKEVGNDLVIELILNGLTKENITIEVVDNRLNITIDDKDLSKEYKKHWSVSKKSLYYDFTQYEESALVENTTSKFENGILYITIPRKDRNNPTKRTIKIQ